MELITLGAFCKSSLKFYENTVIAVNELGIHANILNYGDSKYISHYGIKKTPALIMNNDILCEGKLLSPQQIKQLIENKLNQIN